MNYKERYEVSDDGTEVIDHQTGLIWRKNPELGRFTFHRAQDQAQKVAQETGLPWRVPTIAELITIIDHSTMSPASGFPDGNSTCYWSSTPSVANRHFTWAADFFVGSVNYYSNGYANDVRLVRNS